jgi:hypothetical protein
MLKIKNLSKDFIASKFREDIDSNGKKIFGEDREKLLIGMPIFNTETNIVEKIQ